MENEHVLSALIRKRAEIAGEIGRLTDLADALQSDLACIDRAIRVFDPKAEPDEIKPVRKRLRAPSARIFRHGDFTRAILGVLRDAKAPMTSREISAALMTAHGLRTDHAAIKAMSDRVRAALARQRGDAVEPVDGENGGVSWRVV